MLGWQFRKFDPDAFADNPFDNLLKLFKELLMHSSGNVSEALSWLTQLDNRYGLTTPDYGIADFIREMKEKGYLREDPRTGEMNPAAKMEIELRRKALDDVFDEIKKSGRGEHRTNAIGLGDETTSEIKPYEWGDALDHIAVSETIKNAHINQGIEDFSLTQEDVQVHERFYQSQMSTVLMIDISHSMILYGEDRITPAKKVAMALSELITTRYPKDTLDIIVFGDDAWQIEIKDLPYLQVGPYHTNTVAGLELAMEILRKRKNPNKQIMMITDGKPTCLKIGKKYYQNSFGLDKKILTRCYALAVKCRKQQIPITTFMIARDPWLVQFVDNFTKANDGKAFYSTLEGLGSFIFLDYKQNKRKFKR